MISLIFIVGFFSLLLLPITCISILLSLEPQHDQHDHHNNHTSTATAKPHLSSIWRLLLHNAMFSMNYSAEFNSKSESKDGGIVRRFSGRGEGREKEECRVCLCEVEEGEEISDLRCNHLFHKVCLDAWIGSGHATCPLCRGRVFSPSVADGGAAELLLFQFSSLGTSTRARRREGSWWLR